MYKNLFLIAYFLVALIDLIVVYRKNKRLEYVFKSLLMPLLILYYIFSISSFMFSNWLIILALVGGFFGDFFLVLENDEKWFLFGMASFLIGHIFYIISFLTSIWNYLLIEISLILSLITVVLLIPSLLIIGTTFPKFYKNLKEFKIPVYLYIAIIFIMHLCASLRILKFGFLNLGFLLTWLGSILFIFSDSLIALDTFNREKKIKFINIIIMASYIIAQFFIIQGIIYEL